MGVLSFPALRVGLIYTSYDAFDRLNSIFTFPARRRLGGDEQTIVVPENISNVMLLSINIYLRSTIDLTADAKLPTCPRERKAYRRRPAPKVSSLLSVVATHALRYIDINIYIQYLKHIIDKYMGRRKACRMQARG